MIVRLYDTILKTFLLTEGDNTYFHSVVVFSARQHICYSALYAIARPSVCLSVPLSVTRMDQSKTVQDRITQPSPQSSPMNLVS